MGSRLWLTKAWMEYIYHERPVPADAKGVEVVLDTIDPNGNFYEIGKATSDLYGSYGYAFKPQVPGTYQIIATFAGSNSYGSSKAATYINVAEAAATPAALPVQQTSVADMYFVPAIAGLFVLVIAVVVLLVLLVLRKRP